MLVERGGRSSMASARGTIEITASAAPSMLTGSKGAGAGGGRHRC
jgi:hypothetical protein